MSARAILFCGLVLVPASQAWAQDAERMAMARVHLTTDAAIVKGCTRVGRVNDDSVKDLRRKIVRVGGTTGVLSFGIDDMSMIYAEVFRCAPPSAAPPARPPATPPPADIPPPPPGPPPPPPPSPSR